MQSDLRNPDSASWEKAAAAGSKDVGRLDFGLGQMETSPPNLFPILSTAEHVFF
jgi:hypothetical protein